MHKLIMLFSILQFFQRLHQIYVCEVQNPFQEVGQPVSSVRFGARVQSAMDAFHAKEAQMYAQAGSGRA
jgi:hypothetical protein